MLTRKQFLAAALFASSCIPRGIPVDDGDELGSGGMGGGRPGGDGDADASGGKGSGGIGGQVSTGGHAGPGGDSGEATGGKSGTETGGMSGTETGGMSGTETGGMGGALQPEVPSVFSDEFNGELDARWRWLDPLGDCELRMTGTEAEFVIPESVGHDLWISRAHAPRLLQEVEDTDFAVEVQFNRVPTRDLEGQGLVAQFDDDTLVRADIFSNHEGLKFFVGYVDGASAKDVGNKIIHYSGRTPRLRMRRTDDTWEFSYSLNDTTFSEPVTFDYPITINEIGVYGVTWYGAPRNTVTVEYFREIE